MDLTENTAVKTTAANTVLNTVLIEDIERTLKLPLLKELCGKTVLITGATGLIGQTLTRVLLQYGAGEVRAAISLTWCVILHPCTQRRLNAKSTT